jgi:general secretion pathway protein F
MIYPSIIIAAAFGIVSFLLMFVVPKMVAVFQQSGQILPGPTRLLLAISSGIQNFGLYFMLLLVLGIILFLRALKKTEFKAKVDRTLLRWPLWGKSMRLVNTARFAHTLAILTAAGVDVIEAMRIASEVVGNIPIRKSLELATKQVREGVTVHRALKETTYFPPMSIYLIASGENSGQLENMLERAASSQEKQVTQLIDVILALFEPLMVLVMGGIVLFIVLAILLPIFDLNQFVQ